MAFELLETWTTKIKLTVITLLVAGMSVGQMGCSSTTPTISHVHVGHAITGAHNTPGNEGYFVLAERRAAEALRLSEVAGQANQSQKQIADQLTLVNQEVNLRDDFPLTAALKDAASHIEFAADSADASDNVKRSSKAFSAAIKSVLERSELINLYSQDAKASSNDAEAQQLAAAVLKLSQANLNGEDLDGNGTIGNQGSEYGIRQLRRDLDGLVARENPAYTTVDRWYLFNLIRLPSGDWLFRRRDAGGSTTY